MPTYDFECTNCKKGFTVSTTIAEHMKEKPKCPKCGRKNVKPVISRSFVYTPGRG